MSENSTERKFLHDVATPISIVKGTILHLAKTLKEATAEVDPQYLIDRLERALKSIEELENLHAEHKSYLSRS